MTSLRLVLSWAIGVDMGLGLIPGVYRDGYSSSTGNDVGLAGGDGNIVRST